MIRKPRFSFWAGVCFALVFVTSGNAAERRPNVLFILTDDQRPDTIHALGNDVIRTPNLDKLVHRGVSFTRAVCANPICTPSRGEILTGCSGFRSGVVDFGGKLDPELVCWPQAMRDSGYRTYYVGKWHNDGRPTTHGFERTNGMFTGGGGKWWQEKVDWKGMPVTGYRGWIFQDDEGNLFPERGLGLTPDISSKFADAAIELIKTRDERPFFLQLCFTAPHDPLLLPENEEFHYKAEDMPVPTNFLPEHPFDHGNLMGRDEVLLPFPRTPEMVQKLLAVYYAVITDLDHQVGRVMSALELTGQLENTIVVFTSDHGLGVGSHGIRGKQNMYEHTVGVPLLLAGPDVPVGQIRNTQVYLRDLYPTVCELTNVSVPPTVDGKSFKQALGKSDFVVHPHVFCYYRDSQRMIRTDRWKLIHYPLIDRWQLFDVVNDPHEKHDLYGQVEHRSTVQELQKLLVKRRQAVGDVPTSSK
ncbi:MAG: sulfatase-like hydrolase/transferase [Planctomycetaceae bacterium]|nr:sulfatase-like hydrolase/transferase [Planctomycetaceae bacterium]MCB9949470.1 sulfatase-like hydrolase/transferase [Planctomycetaceae bacterium]